LLSRPQTRYAAALAVILGQYAFVIGVGLGWLWLAYRGWLVFVTSVASVIDDRGFSGYAGEMLALCGLFFAVVVFASLRIHVEPFDIQGVPVTAEREPRLFELISDVTSAVGVPPPDVVYVSLGFELDAVDGGGSWRTGPQRAFVIGLPMLHRLTEVEVRTLMTLQAAHWLPYQHRIGRLVRRLEHTAGWRVLSGERTTSRDNLRCGSSGRSDRRSGSSATWSGQRSSNKRRGTRTYRQRIDRLSGQPACISMPCSRAMPRSPRTGLSDAVDGGSQSHPE
jgi:hypothetical protein